MQGRKTYTEKLFTQFQLSDRVPQSNFYRKLKETLDLEFLRRETATCYGTEGQSSIDPVVFFKLILIGYLENINSDRKIVDHVGMRLDMLYFLGYDIDEPLPWHSTISRTRQLYGEEVFLNLFRKVLGMCINAGMVKGKRQAVDSAFIKANASLDSLVEKEVLEDAVYYAAELDENSEHKVSKTRKKLVDRHHNWKEKEYENQPGSPNKTGHSNKMDDTDENGNIIRPKYLSNHTHYSPTDPDARISVKPGKARQLNYFGQLAVDDAHHVITGAMADFADQRDSQCLPNILGQTIDNLTANHITIDQITADTGYSSGEALKYCEANNIDAYIPNFGQYINERKGFFYNKEEDRYQCTKEGGNKAILLFKGTRTDSKGYTKKTYRSSETDCKNCPLRVQCCGKATKFKKIDDSIHKPLYDRMHQKLTSNPSYSKRISKIRSKTVEPVLGTLLNFMNLKRVNTRGIKQANKHVMMSALAYNLKKYMKFIGKKTKIGLMALQQPSTVKVAKPLNPSTWPKSASLIHLFISLGLSRKNYSDC